MLRKSRWASGVEDRDGTGLALSPREAPQAVLPQMLEPKAPRSAKFASCRSLGGTLLDERVWFS
jgi:hypothetical protein